MFGSSGLILWKNPGAEAHRRKAFGASPKELYLAAGYSDHSHRLALDTETPANRIFTVPILRHHFFVYDRDQWSGFVVARVNSRPRGEGFPWS